METQVVLQDMQEQMGKLTALLKDERQSHQHTCRALLDEAERRAERVRQQQQQEMEQLMQAHRSEISALVAFHTKTLEEERSCTEERYALLEKDYDFLKSSFRTYKDSIFEEMRSSWLRKENNWKEEQERSLMDQLMNARELLNNSEKEKDQQRKAFEAELADLRVRFEEEIQVLAFDLTEKDVTISLLRTALHQTQEQLDIATFQLEDFGKGSRRLRQKRTIGPPPEQKESSSSP